ncbi:MAG TPA: TIGR04066 family peptide maturation system protein [Acetivibrio sp.]|uniref:TIGR04066 family peptide maturation system protein n=1 Tax=Acetivibrio sp. TaxID=1872092 RepID=UPI002B6712F4|nr:TIGR04066 family peptide maturation system protein [Acetivibrio sp.]HOM03450.1 TIGR04066 family peptide maturation system protein [Acetivibrio sp.]
MKKNKILIYPYDLESAPIIRHQKLLDGYEIAALVSPRGWGMNGKDGKAADGGDDIGIVVSSDFEEKLSLCDTVLFAKSHNALDFKSIVLPKILRAIEAGKDIVLCIPVEKEEFDLILGKCNEHKVDFKYFAYSKELAEYPEIPSQQEVIYNICAPVVFVAGVGDRANKFETQLALRENILKKGYKISQIGSREYSELFGFHSFPQFMYSKKISESNKIVMFNHFVKQMEIEEKPDLIIIGIPGGIMPYNNKLTNGFGVLAYEVSQAVTPDSTVFCCHYDGYVEEYFTRLKKSVRYKLGCRVDCFSISNVIFDWFYSKELSRESYVPIDTKILDEKIKDFSSYGETIFNVLNGKDALQMTDFIIDTLSEYGEAECI